MIAASLVEFVVLLRLVLGRQEFRRRRTSVIAVSAIVVVGGMLLGKYGAPLIHVLFAFFLGWNEYMPFIPSLLGN